MNSFLLAANGAGLNGDMDMGERAALGIQILLRGMATVFAVLCIIWLVVVLLRVFLHDIPAKMQARRAAAEAEKKAAQEVAATVQEVTATEADEGELIAVITAAVAAYESENGSNFRVVAFHRVKK